MQLTKSGLIASAPETEYGIINQQVDVLPDIVSYLPKASQKNKIKNAYIFGSAFTDRFNKKKDIDFLVTLQEDLIPVDAGGHF